MTDTKPLSAASGAPPPAYDAAVGSLSSSPSSPPPVPFQTSFASLSLHMSDRLRLVQFPDDDVAAVRALIRQVWREGIQAERPYSVSYEFKLRGRPWSGSGTGPYAVPAILLVRGRPWSGSGTGPYAVPAILLVRDLLACLYARGWIMTASTNISRKEFDKDTLIFRRGVPSLPPASWMALSFKQGDKMRLLGAPLGLVAAVGDVLAGMQLLQARTEKDAASGQYEFKLHGYPWSATGEETMRTRLLMLRLVEVLERHGWSLYASIDQNSGPSGDGSYSETDCWYCVKSSDWTPGSIIIHR